MTDKVNPDRYSADFAVNPDGLVVHGNGPADGAYAMRSANRSVDRPRPKIEHPDFGDFHATSMRLPQAEENPAECPTCHLEHPDGLGDCTEMVAAAREMFPLLDPDKRYTKVTISYLCDATMDEIQAQMPQVLAEIPSGITGAVACEEVPFIMAAKQLAESLVMNQAVEMLEEREAEQSASADDAAEFLRKASSN